MRPSSNPKFSFAIYILVACIWIYDCVNDKLHPLSATAGSFKFHLIAAICFTALAISKGFALRNRTEEL